MKGSNIMMKNTLIKVFSVLSVALCMTACGNDGGTSDKSVTTTTPKVTTTGPVVTTTVATVTNEPEEVVTTSISSEDTNTTTEPTATSDVGSESTTTVTTTVKTTTTPKASTVASTTTKATTTKKKATTTTTTAKKTTTTTTTPKPTTTTTTTSADSSNDLPDGYMHKFTQKEIDSLAEYIKQYAISRGVTWDDSLTKNTSSWSSGQIFKEYDIFFDYESAKERCKEMVDYWIEVLKETCERNNTEFKGVLGLSVEITKDSYAKYPYGWELTILR